MQSLRIMKYLESLESTEDVLEFNSVNQAMSRKAINMDW